MISKNNQRNHRSIFIEYYYKENSWLSIIFIAKDTLRIKPFLISRSVWTGSSRARRFPG